MDITFKPNVKRVAFSGSSILSSLCPKIQDEPMLYGATLKHILDNSDRYPVTFELLMKIWDTDFESLIVQQAMLGYHPVIDTKVVLLMPDMYPCISGWHCDGVIRNERGGQPQLSTLNEDIKHFVCTISDDPQGNHTGTEFITNELTLDIDMESGGNVWGKVDTAVNKALDEGNIKPLVSHNGEIYQFNRPTLHRGLPATTRQWRYFFRLSFYHMPAMNEERKQVQVYIDVNKGW
ncbi:hypothetical protein NVP1208B_62 [Vibrio phage 1.208.B._10N.222.52.A7]|nr:hypothetical protein NVP1208B_62 [Vibrio phage 1.208.B._10N.222.52.A7]